MALEKAKEVVASDQVVVFRSIPLMSMRKNVGCKAENKKSERYGDVSRGIPSPHIVIHYKLFEDVFKHSADSKLDSNHSIKTYCPYCTRVKELFSKLGAKHKVIELDKESDGSEIQAALVTWTGQRTVPNVFISGKHIGGCDNVMEKHNEGKLVPLLTESGALTLSA